MNCNRRRCAAFTLVELLVVISIIALLISILLPSLNTARKQAKKVVCQTNLRSLSQAAFTYSIEFGRYPPSLSNFANSNNPPFNQWHKQGGRDWIGIADHFQPYVPGTRDDPQSGEPKGISAAPRFGVLWPWIKDERAFLCPSDKPGRTTNTITGGGGNGIFSFTQFSMLGLRQPEAIPPRPIDIASGPPVRGGAPPNPDQLLPRPAFARVPQFVEEHPWRINGINREDSSKGTMEGNFNFGDYVVSRHPGFSKRKAKFRFGPNLGSILAAKQGSTNIGFADGHVEAILVNYGFDFNEARSDGGIPDTSQGLLWHFGVEFLEVRNNEPTLVTLD